MMDDQMNYRKQRFGNIVTSIIWPGVNFMMIISDQVNHLVWIFFKLGSLVILLFISSLICFHICELVFNVDIGNYIFFFYFLDSKLFHVLYLVTLNTVCHLSTIKLTVQATLCLMLPVSFLGIRTPECLSNSIPL